ncbi:hypothetical protein [Azohydromonas caseinilytica]|uniref:Glycosyl transferase family 2 n=1 Tax=Azohydromonas caseinilytica TaxID=2728836 RepID=A0A848F4Z2_9BURK|nr:hypothetical protein [Azohydromonas caseinilytica]NML14168.1 hypothetical protein [Azohydromonas caseinilytica]
MLHLDAVPEFELMLFDYSGRVTAAEQRVGKLRCRVLSGATECKGEIYSALARHLGERAEPPEYVALIDDDVVLTVSGINYALHLARCIGIDCFSPALSHDSEYTHRWTLRLPNRLFHATDWVEVMMPFYRGALFLAGAPYYEGNVSSWGIDKYLMPTLQQLLGTERTVIVDAVMATHTRPITSGMKVYRNGLTAEQEKQHMKQLCLELIEQRRPELMQGEWFKRIFRQRHSRTLGQRVLLGIGRPIRRWLERST